MILNFVLSLSAHIHSAMVGVGLWAEFEWDRNLNQFVTTVDNVNDLVGDIQTQVSNQILSLPPPSLSLAMIPSIA